MRKGVIEAAAKHDRILFPVFTNGMMMDDEYLRLFNEKRNIVPVLSLEGNREQTDNRRGAGTYDALTALMDKLKSKGILFGVSVTVTTENIGTVTGRDFTQMLFQKGCRALLFVEYVPVTVNTKPLAPSAADRAFLERAQDELRAANEEMIFLSFPGDEKHIGGCLAAGRGFFHINPVGGAEPCPFSPYSDISLKDHSLLEAMHSPFFAKLKQNGLLEGEHEGGCLLFEKESAVRRLLSSC